MKKSLRLLLTLLLGIGLAGQNVSHVYAMEQIVECEVELKIVAARIKEAEKKSGVVDQARMAILSKIITKSLSTLTLSISENAIACKFIAAIDEYSQPIQSTSGLSKSGLINNIVTSYNDLPEKIKTHLNENMNLSGLMVVLVEIETVEIETNFTPTTKEGLLAKAAELMTKSLHIIETLESTILSANEKRYSTFEKETYIASISHLGYAIRKHFDAHKPLVDYSNRCLFSRLFLVSNKDLCSMLKIFNEANREIADAMNQVADAVAVLNKADEAFLASIK